MSREADPFFSPDERLYRRLAASDVDQNGVRHNVLRFPNNSFDRGKYLDSPAQVLQHGWKPAENGFASVAVDSLPPPLDRGKDSRGNGVKPLITFAADDPTEANSAHCEVRVRRGDEDYDPSLDASKPHKKKIREQLAAAMRIERAPTPV